MLSFMRVADVFDSNAMGRIACVKGRECDWWGISILDDIVDEPFFGDDCCQLGRAVLHMSLRISVGKEQNIVWRMYN
jgi:hypothetical protein